MEKQLLIISLIDVDDMCNYTDRMVIEINKLYVDKLKALYDLWYAFWNQGEGYDTYEEYLEEASDHDDILKNNFDVFLKYGLDSWSIPSLLNICSQIYPNACIVLHDFSELNLDY